MLTEKDLKRIYSIVDEFGGDNKLQLARKLKTLLRDKEVDLKREKLCIDSKHKIHFNR